MKENYKTKVSVVMSVYNGEKFLHEAIDSILSQTYKNFEFIIIDDCSTDESVSIIKSYNDERIRLLKNEVNMRLPASLNKGIRMAKGKYIARMDADDVSLPDRFEKQVNFLETHPEIVALGGSFQAIDENGNNLHVYHPLRGTTLSKYRLLPSPMPHPTVMMRKDILVKNNFFYDEQYSSAQDYDLWLRITTNYKIENLYDILLRYRIQNNSISVSKRQEQQDNTYRIFRKNSSIDISYDECMAIMHRNYILTPWKQAIILHKVFKTLDYIYWRNVIGYAARYIMESFHLNKKK